MPILPNALAKIVSLGLFVLTVVFKVVSILVISGSSDSICIRGWHISDETGMHLQLIFISLIPDIIMIICITIGILSKICNMGADPASIIYNFLAGCVTISAMVPFFGVEDCKSDDLGKIKSVGIITAALAGIVHIANAVLGFLSLAKEESSPPVRHGGIPLEDLPSTSRPSKPVTPAKSAKPAKKV